MNQHKLSRFIRRCICGAGIALVAVVSGSAHAALDSPVAVSLIAPGGLAVDPTPIDATDSIDPIVGVAAGDASTIGSTFMLPGESIQFVDNSILLHVAAGDVAGTDVITGYFGAGGAHARYEFGGLSVTGRAIIGVNVFAFDGFGDAGFSGVVSGIGVSLVTPHSVSFNLDDLVLADRGNGASNAFGEFRIDLLTRAVPEPSTWAMLLLGLAAVGIGAGRGRFLGRLTKPLSC